ncbi:MAG TPA: hypothetical protein VGW38_10755, partial [Chloroflexota bacterium]|nr:hypothetical protein [Chloroflexota bacterium]
LAAALAYEAYLRVLRPFPYGEFKLLSSIWFLVPCLAAAGLVWLQRTNHHRRPTGHPPVGHPPVPVGIVAGVLASALFGAGLVQSQAHAQRFLSEPWGAAIPAAAVADARAVAQAVPQGSSVFVSNLLTLDTALAWHGKPTSGRPQGFPSAEARAIYLGKRWRGIVTSFLSMTGRPVYGLVQRETGELRLPVSPGATDYLLLDALEDPRLHGVLPADQVMAQGTLRLYRRVSRPAAATRPLTTSAASADRANGTPTAALLSIQGTGSELVDIDPANGSGTRAIFLLAPLNSLPRASLPISPIPVAKELPAARRSLNLRNGIRAQPAAVLSSPVDSAGAPNRGQVIIGFHVIAPSHVDISFRDAGEPSGESRGRDDQQNQSAHEPREVRRRLVLLPGLTWYTTPALQWPAEVHVARVAGESAANAAQGNSVWPVIVMSANSGTAPVAEQLEKSAAGSSFPLLTVSSHSEVEGQLTLDAWYSHPGAQEGRWRARLRNSETLWLGGTAIPTAFHPGAGNRHWRIILAPGEAPQQWASDDRSAPEAGAIWQPTSNHHWLWLEIGPYREPAPYEVPMPVLSWRMSGAPSLAPFAAAVFPLLREPAPGLGVADGSLVKGSGEDLFYVDQGRLRWVSSPDVLARRNIPWNLTILEDRALWRLPAALPLT